MLVQSSFDGNCCTSVDCALYAVLRSTILSVVSMVADATVRVSVSTMCRVSIELVFVFKCVLYYRHRCRLLESGRGTAV